MARRIGLFGGSFNPIHCGHLIVARAVAETLRLESVLLLPSARPPHKPGLSADDAAHAAEMVKLAIAHERLFEFSGFDLTRPGPTYTIDTVDHFAREFGPDAELFWIIGADSLRDLPTWHRVSELADACTIVTAARAGTPAPDLSALRGILNPEQLEKLRGGVLSTPRIDISSSDIRRRAQQGLSTRYLVPDAVGTYIESNRLYLDPSGGAS